MSQCPKRTSAVLSLVSPLWGGGWNLAGTVPLSCVPRLFYQSQSMGTNYHPSVDDCGFHDTRCLKALALPVQNFPPDRGRRIRVLAQAKSSEVVPCDIR